MEEKPERKNCNNIRIVATNLIEIDASIQYVVLKLTEKKTSAINMLHLSFCTMFLKGERAFELRILIVYMLKQLKQKVVTLIQ